MEYVDDQEVYRQIQRHASTNWVDFDPQLKAFAYEYLISYDHRAAAEKIGKAASGGMKILRNPLVAAYISFIQENRNLPNVITEDLVRQQYLDLIPKFRGEVAVPMVVDGEEVSFKKFHGSELLQVLRELGKSTKFYENGSGLGGGNVNVSINFGDVTTETPKGITVNGQIIREEPEDG